jgi:hypothetical protein
LAEAFFADGAVVVEGAVDQAVLEGAAALLGTPLESEGVVVLNMESKDNLRIPYAILSSLGIPAYAIADGDADAAARKHPENEDDAARARASHQASTSRLISALPESEVLVGVAKPTFEAPTTVTRHWCLFRDDIETELAAWPSFMGGLSAAGVDLRNKDLSAIRAAVAAANAEDMPENLRRLGEAVAATPSQARPISR